MGGETDDREKRALEAATVILLSRFPEARCGFAAGSIMRGEGTATSDIDLVVVFERLDAAWRESFYAEGFPVEAFVHDDETLAWFMAEDAQRGVPSIVAMVAEGRPVGPDAALACALQTEAADMLAQGPPPLTSTQLDELRYRITDLLEDIGAGRSAAELRAIAASLHKPLADLILLGRRRWSGQGKWIPRLLADLDPALAGEFDDAMYRLCEGDGEPIASLAKRELARHGGALWVGYRLTAPASARLSRDQT
ncbi:nucleotidyltransferase domain-containing protein [Consotaella aegiceratis]|uniref:nucleotidyltransferase domain-containing protein n=1 Tax=Consotaella aegiceratis TaxID=3097961 RepID=UPI002F40BE83